MPMAPSAYVLSPSQSSPFQYVMDVLSNMEPVSHEFLDKEQRGNEQYNIS